MATTIGYLEKGLDNVLSDAEAYVAAGAQLRGEQFGCYNGDSLPALVGATSFRINDFGLETRGAKMAGCLHVFCSSLAAKKSPVSRMNQPCLLTYVFQVVVKCTLQTITAHTKTHGAHRRASCAQHGARLGPAVRVIEYARARPGPPRVGLV